MNTRTMPRTKTRRGPTAPRVPDEEPVVVSPEPPPVASPLLVEGLRSRLGPTGIRAFSKAVRTAMIVGNAFVSYVVAVFLASEAVPRIAALVQNTSGVSLDQSVDLVVAHWLLPVVFLSAAMFAVMFVALRSLWRFQRRWAWRLDAVLVGSVDAPAEPLRGAGLRRRARRG